MALAQIYYSVKLEDGSSVVVSTWVIGDTVEASVEAWKKKKGNRKLPVSRVVPLVVPKVDHPFFRKEKEKLDKKWKPPIPPPS